MNRSAQFLILLAVAFVVGGCGKSKAQREAEAARAAASAAEAIQRDKALELAKAEAQALALAKQEAEAKKREEEQNIEALKAKVVAIMKDPASTQFRSIRLGTSESTLCGEVNSKNSFGGYVGFRPFIVDRDEVIIASPRSSSSFDENLMNLRYMTALETSGCKKE